MIWMIYLTTKHSLSTFPKSFPQVLPIVIDTQLHTKYLPILEDLLLERSIIARLLGLFRTERLASAISAVTLVIDILWKKHNGKSKIKIFNKYNSATTKIKMLMSYVFRTEMLRV